MAAVENVSSICLIRLLVARMAASVRANALDGCDERLSTTFFTRFRDLVLVFALALPFLGQLLPYGIPIFLPVTLLALGLALMCRGWRLGMLDLKVPVNGFTLAVALVLASVFYGMALSQRVDGSLFGEAANAIGVLLLYFAVTNAVESRGHREMLLRKLMALLLAVAVIAAILGIIKFVLFLGGQRIAYFADTETGEYPFGTSLINDYNLFALSLLCGIAIALGHVFTARRVLTYLAAALVCCLLVVAGFFAGSRRFWVVTPVVILLITALGVRARGPMGALPRLMSIAAVVAALLFIAIQFAGDLDLSYLSNASRRLEVRLLSLLDADRAGGFDQRLIRWDFAWAMADGFSAWVGQGFDYLHAFSCRFGGCVGIDYPHNPFLSALLYAGVFGVLAVGLLLFHAMCSALRLLWGRPVEALAGVLLLIHLPFILVSSNTILSVKSFLVSALLCNLHAGRVRPLSAVEDVDPAVTSMSIDARSR